MFYSRIIMLFLPAMEEGVSRQTIMNPYEPSTPNKIPIHRLPVILYACAILEAWRVAALMLNLGRHEPTTAVVITLTTLLAVVFIAFCATLASAAKAVASGAPELDRYAFRLKAIAYAAAAVYTLSWAFGWLWVASFLGTKEASLSILAQTAGKLPLLIALLLLVDFLERAQRLRRAGEGTV